MTSVLISRAVTVLRGMAYEHRLHILVLLRDSERTAGELSAAVPADPTAVAHHLRCLLDARLVQRRRRGRNVVYSLPDDATRHLIAEVLRHASRRPTSP
ncbi:metalloregulator ArsR/SmtB family transcription factor [Actinoplanes sp. NPDC051861]|uniref:ArsR/SmtB family transcription factor n=1 Tax=Actinoplanes sp. NPDC051861 TaxID=3155170 RepID=UPI003448086F